MSSASFEWLFPLPGIVFAIGETLFIDYLKYCCWPFFKNSCMNFCFYLAVVSTCVWTAQRIVKEEKERDASYFLATYLSVTATAKCFLVSLFPFPHFSVMDTTVQLKEREREKRLEKESFWKYFFLFLSFILGDEQLEAATPVWCSPSLSVCLTTVPSASAECDRVLYPLYGSVQQQNCWSVVSVCVCMCVCVTVVQKSFAVWDYFFSSTTISKHRTTTMRSTCSALSDQNHHRHLNHHQQKRRPQLRPPIWRHCRRYHWWMMKKALLPQPVITVVDQQWPLHLQ